MRVDVREMEALSPAARVRLKVGLGLLVAAAVVEVVALFEGFGGCGDGSAAWGLLAIAWLLIPAVWVVALVFLIWGRTRTVYGLVRLGALLGVALGFPIAGSHLFSVACFG